MMTNAKKSVGKIEQLLSSSQNIFTTQDLAVIWDISDKQALYASIQYYLQSQRLQRIHKGVYALRDFNSFELAAKLISPSYISLYSALSHHGLIFQFYQTLHSMSVLSKEIQVDEDKFVYHQLKDQVFYDSLGIVNKENYQLASPERAVCDTLYLFSEFSFDDLSKLDFSLLEKVSKIYHNQRLEKEVQTLIVKEQKQQEKQKHVQ